VLTDAGARLRVYALKLLQLEAEARQAVSGTTEPSGALHIGAPESQCTYRLPPLLAEFRRRYPRVKLILRPASCGELRRGVLDGSLDVAFTMDDTAPPPLVSWLTIAEDPIFVLAPPEHPFATRDVVHPEDLAGEVVLMTEPDCAYRQMFERRLAEVGIEFMSIEAIKQSAMAAMGLAVLPGISVESELALKRLALLPFAPAITIDTYVMWHKDKWLSPALAAFIGLVEERFGDHAATPARA
jgi:DNA-binding transcriptional LysR family regulator